MKRLMLMLMVGLSACEFSESESPTSQQGLEIQGEMGDDCFCGQLPTGYCATCPPETCIANCSNPLCAASVVCNAGVGFPEDDPYGRYTCSIAPGIPQCNYDQFLEPGQCANAGPPCCPTESPVATVIDWLRGRAAGRDIGSLLFKPEVGGCLAQRRGIYFKQTITHRVQAAAPRASFENLLWLKEMVEFDQGRTVMPMLTRYGLANVGHARKLFENLIQGWWTNPQIPHFLNSLKACGTSVLCQDQIIRNFLGI